MKSGQRRRFKRVVYTWNHCAMCGVRIKRGRPVFCGSWRRKTGCSFKNKKIMDNKYRADFYERNPHYSRDKWREKNWSEEKNVPKDDQEED